MNLLKNRLDELYDRYNRRGFVHPDPLEFLYEYEDPADREVVGLVASSLAYGRVAQILKSVRAVLDRLPSPARFIRDASRASLAKTFIGFKHRFASAEDLAALLYGAASLILDHGSLEAAFFSNFASRDDTVLPALTAFAARLQDAASHRSHLLPCPSAGSACKRLHLYLRWMVREDAVDPGGWRSVPPSKLIVPLDVHMHRICARLGLTDRKHPDANTAIEVTRAFRAFAPVDPVRYDFALTRLGIRRDADPEEFLALCLSKVVA